MDDIHGWFVANLKSKETDAEPRPAQPSGHVDSHEDNQDDVTFQVYITNPSVYTTSGGQVDEKILLCPNAAFANQKHNVDRDPTNIASALQCICRGPIKHSDVLHSTCMYFSVQYLWYILLIRVVLPTSHLNRVVNSTGERRWEIAVRLRTYRRAIMLSLKDNSPTGVFPPLKYMRYSTEA